MRGKQGERDPIEKYGGLIPAHAGKTGSFWAGGLWITAHPRACGENTVTGSPTTWASGSSPRMRGKPGAVLRSCVISGLIPAHAGKTAPKQSPAPMNWAHPRACGENFTLPFKVICSLGSSPRMRGKQRGIICQQMFSRLIPAHAGKTDSPVGGR